MSVVADEVKVIWAPQAGPQTALVQCPVFEIFFGGSRGGGKTDGMIGEWLQHSALYGENAIGIFVRRNLTQLSEVIARTKQLFSKIGAKYNTQRSEWLMPTGARLRFVYLERDSDAENYQGHNYTRVYVEEVTNFPSPGPINKLRATLRSSAGVPVGMRLTGNPGGPGHNWVKARYVDPCPQGYQIIEEREEVELSGGDKISVSLERVFIPSQLRDNPLLLDNQPTYVLQLKQTGSEALVRAWLLGDWDMIQGAYFDDFKPDRHIISSSIELPPHWARFRAFDWGSAKPFSVGWYAVADGLSHGFPAGALIKYDEFYGWNGTPNVGLRMSALAVGKAIRERDIEQATQGFNISYGLADPSIFAEDGGPSIAESMLAGGCHWARADNKRIPGWEQMHIRFQANPPMLYISERCEHTIRCISSVQHSETKPEDLDTDGEDHAVDETRYACMSRPMISEQPRTPQTITYAKSIYDMSFDELVKQNRQKRLQAESSW
jgi:Terminase large subunit, T4likevirus-type, N-terminal